MQKLMTKKQDAGKIPRFPVPSEYELPSPKLSPATSPGSFFARGLVALMSYQAFGYVFPV